MDSQTGCPHNSVDTKWEQTMPRGKGQNVKLPANTKVLLTGTSLAASEEFGFITIPKSSQLIFSDEEIHLKAAGIHVLGALLAGSQGCRLCSYMSITLLGKRPKFIDQIPEPTFKGINVDGGRLEIHSAEYYHTWSRLAVTAKRGDKMLLLQDPVNWDVGMQIVVTSTQLKDSRDWHQNEVAIVSGVKGNHELGTDITAVYLESGLKYDHYGGAEYQAEVGLLERRFVIQGDAKSEPKDQSPIRCSTAEVGSLPCADTFLTGFGGHVIVQSQGVAKISGVEFYRMGMTNFDGRYPIHFHMLGEKGKDSYVRDSSFHRSFYRCATIHGSSRVSISRNVAYDIIGHCLYLEDGVETFNVIEFNLHAHIHPIGMPAGAGSSSQFLDEVESSDSLAIPSDVTASGFYITNAENYIRGNAAVGGFSGYQFPVLPSAVGLSRDSPITPRKSYTLEFNGNSCRSAGYWWEHGGCVYVGGEFYHKSASSRWPIGYNPGRLVNGWRPCSDKDKGGEFCDAFGSRCTGPTAMACYEFIRVTNFKASLSTIGYMNWGMRSRLYNIEFHDIVGGPSIEAFGYTAVDQLLVTCRTDNFPNAPPFCGSSMQPHEGHQGSVPCKSLEQRKFRRESRVFTWYDTNAITVIANATIRKCDPKAWPSCDQQKACAKSRIFEFTAHSDKHLPEYMSLTAGFKFEDAKSMSDDDFYDRVVDFNTRTPAIAARFSGWLDADGAVCKKNWGPSIIGSNNDAGKWWHLSNDCIPLSEGLAWCCPANGAYIASFKMNWDPSIDAKLDGSGGKQCDNQFGGGAKCDRVGYIGRFGDENFESDAMPVHQRAEVVGVVPKKNQKKGAGWYLRFDEGAPKQLVLKRIQVHHDSTLILAITYPLGTKFTITMNADDTCSSGLCEEEFQEIEDGPSNKRYAVAMPKLYSPAGSRKFFTEDNGNSTTLYVRIVQRLGKYLGDDDNKKKWDDKFKVPLFNINTKRWRKLEKNFKMEKRDWGLPLFTDYPSLTIDADCDEGKRHYCDGGQQPTHVPPLWR